MRSSRFVQYFSYSYIVIILFLFLYSFTQVDLDLTLSQWSIYQVAEKFFQHIGYFQRPLSTAFYVILLVLLFLWYGGFLYFAKKHILSKRTFWIILIAISVLLTFSYNGFSYDIFNYIFDARIITLYHQNPYLHKALDFPQDHMLTFMRWTHRTYPYGPVWLILTVPLSFIGLQIFLPTFFLFKALMTAGFLGTVYYIGKVARKFFHKDELFILAFFAFNPLVIIESIVSSHMDIVMMFFSILGIYLLFEKKYVSSFITLLVSIGIKFATIGLLPVCIVKLIKKKMTDELFFLIATACMAIMVVTISIHQGNFQPWYVLEVLPLAAFVSKKMYIRIPAIIISITSLAEYIPFLYQGDWNPPVPTILFALRLAGIGVSLIVIGVIFATQKFLKRS